MKKIVHITINSKINSFGTKTIIFMTKEGDTYIASREEGSHHELENGKKVYDAEPWENEDCTLRG